MKNCIIIGAGIAGLSVAGVLKRQGLSFQLLERRGSYAHEGAGILLWNNALQALCRLGFSENVKAFTRPVQEVRIFDDKGAALNRFRPKLFANEFGPGAVSFYRPDLQALLSQKLDPQDITFGFDTERIEFSEKEVTVHSKDGQTWTAEALIVADGSRSMCRELLGDKPHLVYAKHAIWRGVCDDWRKDQQAGCAYIYVGQGTYAVLQKMENSRLFWAASQYSPQEFSRPKDLLDSCLTLYRAWPSPLQQSIANTAKSQVVWHPIYRHNRTHFGFKRNILYVGDAAHATSPQIAQGAAMALEDAVRLMDCLEGAPDLSSAIADFRKRGTQRQDQVIKKSTQLSKSYHLQSPVLQKIRNVLVARSSEDRLLKRIRSIVEVKI